MVDDDVKRIKLEDAEQTGYELGKGMQRALLEAEEADDDPTKPPGNKEELIQQLELLKENGCTYVRPGGNHDIYHSPITGKDFPVPRHSSADVKKGLLNRILKQSGIKRTAKQ